MSTWLRSRERQAGDNGFTGEEERLVRSEVPEDWLRGLQSYTLRWVAQAYGISGRPGGVDGGGEHVPANETQAVRLR